MGFETGIFANIIRISQGVPKAILRCPYIFHIVVVRLFSYNFITKLARLPFETHLYKKYL